MFFFFFFCGKRNLGVVFLTGEYISFKKPSYLVLQPLPSLQGPLKKLRIGKIRVLLSCLHWGTCSLLYLGLLWFLPKTFNMKVTKTFNKGIKEYALLHSCLHNKQHSQTHSKMMFLLRWKLGEWRASNGHRKCQINQCLSKFQKLECQVLNHCF